MLCFFKKSSTFYRYKSLLYNMSFLHQYRWWLIIGLLFLFNACSTPSRTISENEVLGEGIASWYGPGFHGNRTASGERYNQDALTAAHRTLPFNTVVRVVNLNNGKSVDVRINDRGPFADNRIIDLSREAARRVDMVQSGLAPVRIILLSSVNTIDPNTQQGEIFTVQVASFERQSDANAKAANIREGWVQPAVVNGRQFYRVFVGQFANTSEAERRRRTLRRQGINGFVKQVQN